MAINKKSFLTEIKRRVYSKPVNTIRGAAGAAKNYYKAHESNKKAKLNIDKLARQKVKKNIVGGESQEQLQQAFIRERKKLRKKYGY